MSRERPLTPPRVRRSWLADSIAAVRDDVLACYEVEIDRSLYETRPPPSCPPNEHEWVCKCGELAAAHDFVDPPHALTGVGCGLCHRMLEDVPEGEQ